MHSALRLFHLSFSCLPPPVLVSRSSSNEWQAFQKVLTRSFEARIPGDSAARLVTVWPTAFTAFKTRSPRLAAHSLLCQLAVCPVRAHLDHLLDLACCLALLAATHFHFSPTARSRLLLLSPPAWSCASTFHYPLSPASAAACSRLCPLIALSGTCCLAVCSRLYLLLLAPAVCSHLHLCSLLALAYASCCCPLSPMPTRCPCLRSHALPALAHACSCCPLSSTLAHTACSLPRLRSLSTLLHQPVPACSSVCNQTTCTRSRLLPALPMYLLHLEHVYIHVSPVLVQ